MKTQDARNTANLDTTRFEYKVGDDRLKIIHSLFSQIDFEDSVYRLPDRGEYLE